MAFRDNKTAKKFINWTLWVFLVLAGVVFNDNYSEPKHSDTATLSSGSLRLSFHRSQNLFQDGKFVKGVKTSLESKFVNYRRKFNRLIESNDILKPLVKTGVCTYYTNPYSKIIYEAPQFISKQLSFIFRLTYF